MNRRTPQLRKHATGQWLVRWGNRDHYLGHDRAAAQHRYLQHLQAWSEWRQARDAGRLAPTTRTPTTVAELARDFLNAKELERGLDCRRYYTNHLKRLLAAWQDLHADLLRPKHLHALKQQMLLNRYSHRTVNHDLIAVRALFNWACGLELILPVSFKGVKNLPLGPVPDKALTPKQVGRMLAKATRPLLPWLAINYLAVLRPSEVVRCVLKQGEWVQHGVFVLDRGKTDLRATLRRHCLFSAEALRWLKGCQPVWTRLDSYSAACRRDVGQGPGVLRHSAATCLERLGASSDHIELLLGHTLPRIRVTYRRPDWRAIRRTAARLTLPRA